MENFKYNYNLATTLTETSCIQKEQSIDYSNSISLFDLVTIFNKAYLSFQKDLVSLPRLPISSYALYDSTVLEEDSKKAQKVTFLIPNPLRAEKGAVLNIYKTEDHLFYRVFTKSKWYYDEEATDALKLDPELIRKYLDLLYCHQDFFNAYNTLREAQVVGDGTHTLFTKISGDILNELSTLRLAGGSTYFMKDSSFSITYQLGENMGALQDSLKWTSSDESPKKDCHFVEDLAKELYINRSLLPSLFSKEKGKILQKK